MPPFTPSNPNFESLLRDSFKRQTVMHTLGAKLRSVEPGAIEIELPFRDDLAQQHGFLHAGILATIADSACGYSALSLMPEGSAVLAIEFKTNFLSPAVGERFIARGRVVRAGKTITVCAADVVAMGSAAGAAEKHVAIMQSTMMRIEGREGMKG